MSEELAPEAQPTEPEPSGPPPSDDPIENVREAARQLSAWRTEKRKKDQEAAASDEAPPELEMGDHSVKVDPEPEPEPQAEEAEPIGETEAEAEPQELEPIEPPLSWTAEEKERFQSLPRETQEYLATRERERDTEIRRKQNEIAERMRQLEPEQAALMQARQQYEQLLPQMIHQMQSTGEFNDIQTMADVERLAAEDWPRYVKYDAHQKKLAALHQEYEQSQYRQAEEWTNTFQQYANEQDAKFAELVPEILDPEKGKQLQELTINTLEQDYGFTPEEMQNAWNGAFRDYRVQQVLLDAARYRQLKKNPPKPAKTPPSKVVKPGAAAPRAAVGSEEIKRLEQRLNETGSLKDAARLHAAKRRLAMKK